MSVMLNLPSEIEVWVVGVLAVLATFHGLVLAIGGLAKLIAAFWPPAIAVVNVCSRLSTDVGWLLGLLSRLSTKPADRVGPTLVLLLIAAGTSLPACQGTFEEARGVASINQFATASKPRCEELSDREVAWGYAAIVSGSLAAPTGLAAIPTKDETGKAILIGTGALLAANAVGAEFVSDYAGRAYVREGCARE